MSSAIDLGHSMGAAREAEPGCAAGGAHSQPSEAPKVSHSQSEKQRRDRINTMINNLRTLVPPSFGAGGGGEATPCSHLALSLSLSLSLRPVSLSCL
jgi:hypothetical protein